MRLLKSSPGGPCPFAGPVALSLAGRMAQMRTYLSWEALARSKRAPARGRARYIVLFEHLAFRSHLRAKCDGETQHLLQRLRIASAKPCAYTARPVAPSRHTFQSPTMCTHKTQPQAPSCAAPAAEVSAGDVCAKARLRTQSRCPVRRQRRTNSPPPGGANSSVIAASTPPRASSSLRAIRCWESIPLESCDVCPAAGIASSPGIGMDCAAGQLMHQACVMIKQVSAERRHRQCSSLSSTACWFN